MSEGEVRERVYYFIIRYKITYFFGGLAKIIRAFLESFRLFTVFNTYCTLKRISVLKKIAKDKLLGKLNYSVV